MQYAKGIVCALIVFFSATASYAQQAAETWMPVPQSWQPAAGHFELDKQFTIGIKGTDSERLYAYATWVLKRLDWQTGLFIDQDKVSPEQPEATLSVQVNRPGELKLGMDETYQLEITDGGISLTAETDIGAMRGLETFLQLVKVHQGKYVVSKGAVQDAPRFPWRGLMIDVSRHFQPVEVIKRNIDGMAMVKMNVLHLHLVDDHGFRVESKAFPELNTKASNGQFFTQNEIKDIVSYASAKGIRVVPEFDIPGHASAFLTAFPDLGSAPGPYHLQNRSGIFDPTLDPTNDATYTFLNALFEEMTALFPDEYFHIGGDENEGKHWNSNEQIQAYMLEHGFKDIHQLQNHFIIRVQETLASMGKQVIGWDEILNEDLPKTAVIHSWRGVQGLKTAAEGGYQCLLSNGFYIDLMKRASDHYLVDPLPKGLELSAAAMKNVLGGEATMWSELVTPATIDSRIWPRTAAIAERLWSSEEVRDVDDMYRRLQVASLNLERIGLTHISNREVLLRNLTHGLPTEALKTLANVAEPMEGYTRNPGGDLYEFHNPFNQFADITIADAPDARAFAALVSDYQLTHDADTEKKIKVWLEKWKANHEQIETLIDANPALEEVRALSANLQACATVGLEAIGTAKTLTDGQKKEWYGQVAHTLANARKQGARTELQVVDAIGWLAKQAASQVVSVERSRKVKTDGKLKDWNQASWAYFVSQKVRGRSDTCYYATMWDQHALYFAFRVKNKKLQAKAKSRDQHELWLDDGIEILIDPHYDQTTDWSDDDIAYHVNIFNAVFDEKGLSKPGVYNKAWEGSATTAVKLLGTANDHADTDIGYTVEVTIPWKELGLEPKEGMKMGVNLAVNDRHTVSGDYVYYDLMGLKEFHRPAGFSELVLAPAAH